VVNLDILTQLVNDRELRGQVSRLLANKVRADVKSLETGALLSRRLLERAAAAQRGQEQPNGAALRGLIKEHLDFYELLVSQTLAFNQRLAERLHGLGAPLETSDSVMSLRLAAPLNSTLRAPFRLENNRSTPISVSFEITPFVGESGTGIVSAEAVFDPPALELKPAQEAKIDLILAITPGFVPGNTYLATVTVKGLEATQLLVRLQVEAERTESAQPATDAKSPAVHVAPAVDAVAPAPEPERKKTPPKRKRSSVKASGARKPGGQSAHKKA